MALPLCLLIGLTGATRVTRDDVRIDLDGVRFALEVAAGTAPDWSPAAGDWHPSTEPVTVDLEDDTPVPGAPVDVRLALRNTSGVPARVALALADPGGGDPALFAALDVEVSEDGVLLASGHPADVLVDLPGDVAADRAEVRVLDLRLRTPVSGDDRWAGSRTGVQVVVQGTSR